MQIWAFVSLWVKEKNFELYVYFKRNDMLFYAAWDKPDFFLFLLFACTFMDSFNKTNKEKIQLKLLFYVFTILVSYLIFLVM